VSNKKMVSVESLVFDPANARKHDERNIKAIMDSLERHGQRKPIVCYSNMVVAGNGTLQAAKRLGWTEIWVNDDGFESIEDAKAYAIQDNRSAELAAWDDVVLGDTLTELKEAGWDLETVGFKDHEYDLILNGGFVPDLPDEETKQENEQKFNGGNQFAVMVICGDERQQQEIFERLSGDGYTCKVVVV